MELLVYLKTLSFFLILFICGIIIIRRLTEENRAQILIPSGAVLGIAFYIFLINAVAHVIKSAPGFYLALAIEISVAFLIKRHIVTRSIEFPKQKFMIYYLISVLFWGIFLYILLATGDMGGDIYYHYGIAALFSRGDYPMHTPWQPDHIMTYHFGGAEFLGAARSVTGGSFLFIHRLLAVFMFFSWSQILTWLLVKKVSDKFSSLLVITIPAFVGLISLGGFMIAWPVTLAPIHFSWSIFQWLGQLPILNSSMDSYGSPLVLDMMVTFLHRFLALSFFFSLLCILLLPRKGNYPVLIAGTVILLSSIALTDESVLAVILPAVFLVSFFTLFDKSIPKTLTLIVISILVICLQGGLITETLFNRQNYSGILFFPKEFQKYQAYQISSRLFENLPNYQPFRWFHPGIIWQLSLLLLISVSLQIKSLSFVDFKDKRKLQAILCLFFISSLTSLVAFYGIVPKLLSVNGNRFLSLSYYLSALGITFYLVEWWFSNTKRLLVLRFIIVWILLFSLIPPLFNMFPRPTKYHGLMPPSEPDHLSFNWIRDNLEVKERIIVLTQSSPFELPNIALSTVIGALTPMWDREPRAEVVWEMTPLYADAYFTLNPDILRTLKINYLIIGNNYLPQLAVSRRQDLVNKRYFQPVFIDSTRKETIFKVSSEYLNEGQNLGGTLSELEQIAPKKGTFYIEYVPNISENMFRALRVLLYDRDVYHPVGAAFYNGSIDIQLIVHNTLLETYDYLVLGATTNPETICHCDAKLLWTGFGNGIKLWKT